MPPELSTEDSPSNHKVFAFHDDSPSKYIIMSFLRTWNEAVLSSLGLFWTAFWAFCFGYLVSSMIQVFVTRARMQQLMGKAGLRSMALGTFFGFISSSCSFAALSGARALFAKGAGLAPALAYLLSSTNLVIELGIIIAMFLSWQFVVAEYVGGIVLILLVWFMVHCTGRFAPIEQARQRARQHEGSGCVHDEHDSHKRGSQNKHQGHDLEDEEETNGASDRDDEEKGNEQSSGNPDTHNTEQGDDRTPENLSSNLVLLQKEKWEQVAMHYYMEWSMVWKDVTFGFTIAGVIAAFVPHEFFEWLFLGGADPSFGQVLQQCIVGPVAAFFTFIGSMGNIPLAAVLYGNGVSFAGIMAFIFSDLVVLPVLRVNAKYYGWTMALYILGVFLTALVLTALILYYVFKAIGILPSSEDAKSVTDRDYFAFDYTFGLNVAFGAMSVLLFGWHFKQNRWKFTMGSSVVEILLFWLALASYIWIIGGLFAGLAR